MILNFLLYALVGVAAAVAGVVFVEGVAFSLRILAEESSGIAAVVAPPLAGILCAFLASRYTRSSFSNLSDIIAIAQRRLQENEGKRGALSILAAFIAAASGVLRRTIRPDCPSRRLAGRHRPPSVALHQRRLWRRRRDCRRLQRPLHRTPLRPRSDSPPLFPARLHRRRHLCSRRPLGLRRTVLPPGLSANGLRLRPATVGSPAVPALRLGFRRLRRLLPQKPVLAVIPHRRPVDILAASNRRSGHRPAHPVDAHPWRQQEPDASRRQRLT